MLGQVSHHKIYFHIRKLESRVQYWLQLYSMAVFQHLTFRNLAPPFEIKVDMQVVPMEFSHQPTVPVREMGFRRNLTSIGSHPGLLSMAVLPYSLALHKTQ